MYLHFGASMQSTHIIQCTKNKWDFSFFYVSMSCLRDIGCLNFVLLLLLLLLLLLCLLVPNMIVYRFKFFMLNCQIFLFDCIYSSNRKYISVLRASVSFTCLPCRRNIFNVNAEAKRYDACSICVLHAVSYSSSVFSPLLPPLSISLRVHVSVVRSFLCTEF